MLVLMHRGKMSYAKEWMHQNYGTKCVLIGDKECERIFMLNIKKMLQKVKDIEKCLSDELRSRNKYKE